MRILVTRPKDDAEATAAKLSALGHTALIAPMLEIRYRAGPETALERVQAILATSSNGVYALARRTPRRDVPLFAVGSQTANAAKSVGFKTVKSADGDAAALAKATAEWANPSAGVLVHAAGADTKGDLAGTLMSRGFDVRVDVLYEAVASVELPPVAREALEAGAIDGVLFFSPRSANAFSQCVVKAGLVDRNRKLVAYCVSKATADALSPLKFRDVRIAPHPDQDALLALIA